MVNSPLDINTVTFWLRFNSLGRTDWYEINEPIGFYGAKLVIEQEAKKFNRSVKYGAIDKVKFVNALSIKTVIPFERNQRGDLSENRDYGLEWLLYIFKKFGFEMDVDFKIMFGNVDFNIYGLDASDKDITDGREYFQCKLIDSSKVADYKRRWTDTLNAFATKDVFENTITPIQTFNYLRRAIPIVQTSKWETTPNTIMYSDSLGNDNQNRQSFFNQIKTITNSGIKDTLIGLTDYSSYDSPSTWSPPLEDFKILKARNTITNIKVKVKVNLRTHLFTDNGVSSHGRIICMFIKSDSLVYPNFNTPNQFTVFTTPNIGSDGSQTSYDLNQTFDVDLGSLHRDNYIFFFFTQLSTYKSLVLQTTLFEASMEMSAISTSLDSVVSAFRYSDLLKQGNKMVKNYLLHQI